MSKIIFYFLVIVAPFSYADNLNLQKGIGVNDSNLNELARTSWEYAKASTTQKKFDDGFAVAFLKVNNSTDLYSLSGSSKLYLTNFDTRNVLGNWPLFRWQNEYVEQELKDTYQYGMEWSEILTEPTDLMGCMLRSSLRYGDVTGDGKGELIVLLPSEYSVDWSVFSTTLNKIIFSNKLNYTNLIPNAEVPDYLTANIVGDKYQYWLRTGVETDRSGQMAAALRAYGKLYIGDFNKDGAQDILLWRKLYQSKTKDDLSQGFQLVRQKFLHYQLKNGDFQPVSTDEALIEDWLKQNGLTWQKGFPSTSECTGEEGKLIPEMHDPLLNDPDVLK